MYDELVKRLRCQLYGNCPACVNWYTEEVEPNLWRERCAAIDAADAIEKLSRRETPMRLRITTSTKRCPSCNKQVSGIGNIHGNYRYCRWCGQAIDWSDSGTSTRQRGASDG